MGVLSGPGGEAVWEVRVTPACMLCPIGSLELLPKAVHVVNEAPPGQLICHFHTAHPGHI